MKKIIVTALVVLTFATMNAQHKKGKLQHKKMQSLHQLSPVSDATAENSVIYEANIRNYSPEGTFNAFTKDIPKLKQLGVKVLWVMPIYPISMKRRKATADKSIEDITDPAEKKKYLGSWYAISDYTAVNPDLGTLEDFQKLVKTAHDNGMYVILDWVANHTGWDHKWITEHPEYYEKNKKGEVTDPLNPETGEPWGWTDVAHLDYKNKKVYEPMLHEMMYWVKDQGIDGFRCDVADNVPTDFWNFALPKLKAVKPLFMLMESEKEYLLKGQFDMGYGFEAHHVMNDIAKGTKTVADWDKLMVHLSEKYEKDDIMMNLTSSHDENAWNGSEYERMGDAAETFAALTYVMPGMPLIYTGQEYDNKKRLKFFEQDPIEKNKGKMFDIYQKLGELKNNNVALNGGKNAAAYTRIKTSNDTKVLAFERSKHAKKVYYIANLTKSAVSFTVPVAGTFTNCMTGEKITLSNNQTLQAKPWQYWILTN
jgi:1,4-alpha-glucan branching enzyme